MTFSTTLRTAFFTGACFLTGYAHQAKAQGQLDGTFQVGTGPNQPVEAIAVQSDGKILIGGGFTQYNGVVRPCIARLNEDGSLDTSFDPGQGANGVVRDIAVRSDGKILIAGDFTTYAGAASNRIALLNTNGAPETSFNAAGVDGPIHDLDLDGSGNIVIGGQFTHCEGEVRNKVARLQSNGNLDLGFDPGEGANGNVFAVLPIEGQAGSSIFVGGDFSTFGGHSANGLAHLGNDGAMGGDQFDFQLDGPGTPAIRAIRPWNGEIIVGGNFTTVNENFAHYIATAYQAISANGPDASVNELAVTSDGHIYLGGTFQHVDGVARAGFARLNADGTLDQTFDVGSGVNGLGILAMALDRDGRVLIGGGFTQYNGSAANRLARICIGPQQTWYPDVDGDGKGDTQGAISTCGVPTGYTTVCCDPCPNLPNAGPSNQCDDGDPATIYDLITNDCVCAGKSGVIVTQFPWDQNFNGLGTGGFVYDHDEFLGISGGNNWMIGNATGDGAPSLYVSDGNYLVSSSANHYSTGNASSDIAVHTACERQLVLPADATDLNLSLRWKGMGVAGRDYLKILMGPQEQPPDEGWPFYTLVPGNQWVSLSGELSGQSDWTTASFSIPPSFAGRTVWVEFVWFYHSGPGLVANNPPAAIDNIHLCVTIDRYGDADHDGFGDPTLAVTTCGEQPLGYVANASDDCPMVAGRAGDPCDDGDPNSVNDVIGLNCVCEGTTLPWSEDFSNGPGGFNLINGTQDHEWAWGHAKGTPEPSIYITEDAGATYGYPTNEPARPASVVHLIHDLPTIPANATSIQLGFDHDNVINDIPDHLEVWMVPLDFVPTAGVPITATGSAPAGRVKLNLPLGGSTQVQGFQLPLAYAGQAARIVFEWQDDGVHNLGEEGPTYLDNIHLCVITPQGGDSDGDGLADCTDPCPMLAGLSDGDPCDDGNPGTINDAYEGCTCVGHPFFTEGRLVVLQVGPVGDISLATGKQVVLQEINAAGQFSASVTVPSSGANALIVDGQSPFEGRLSLSSDSSKLVFAGYARALPNSTVLGTSASATIPRAIGTVDAGGNFVRQSTSSTFFSGGSIRAACAAGTNLWADGSVQGLDYFGGGAAATVASGKTSFRSVRVFNGQLYVSSASTSGSPANTGVFSVGTGLPTTAGQSLTTIANTNSTNTGDFCFNPAGTVLYVAIGSGGIQKWVHTTTWNLAYTMTFSEGAYALVGDFSGANTILYFVTNAGDKLMKITDPNAGTGSVAVTPALVRNANVANTAFRGVSWAPKVTCAGNIYYADTDGDGFGDPAMSISHCPPAPTGYVADNTDSCPLVFGKAGSACSDGNGQTVNDMVGSDCTCAGYVPTLQLKAFLQGPLNPQTMLMSDALRSLPDFPLTEPYPSLGLATSYASTLNPAVLAVTGNNAIVDWVLVELRSATSPTAAVFRRSALLQRDGDVVATDGVSPLTFPGAGLSYYVILRHRNHLPIATAAPVSFSATPLTIDFTSPSTAVWGTDARIAVGTGMALFMGDSNMGGVIRYTGATNDRDPILVAVGGTTPNNVVNGYSGNDTNMDGSIKYTGSANDRDPILLNVGNTTPNNSRFQQLP